MNPIDLHKHSKIESGFKTPEGYFEQFESKLLLQIPFEETKIVSINSNKKYWYGAIAAIIILAVSIPIYQNWKVNEVVLADQDSIEYYLSYHPTVTTEDLIHHLDDADLSALQRNQSLELETMEKYLLENETIENYLID